MYKKQKHTDEVNNMLAGYLAQGEINEVDIRLLAGVATKVPLQELPQKVVVAPKAQVVRSSRSKTNLVEVALMPETIERTMLSDRSEEKKSNLSRVRHPEQRKSGSIDVKTSIKSNTSNYNY